MEHLQLGPRLWHSSVALGHSVMIIGMYPRMCQYLYRGSSLFWSEMDIPPPHKKTM
jgi:hypothetical protein